MSACANCGAKSPKGYDFCRACGYREEPTKRLGDVILGECDRCGSTFTLLPGQDPPCKPGRAADQPCQARRKAV